MAVSAEKKKTQFGFDVSLYGEVALIFDRKTSKSDTRVKPGGWVGVAVNDKKHKQK